jgi:hypothetical protein
MTADTIALLKKIAKQFGKSVRNLNGYDANVCTSPFHPERPWEILALPGDIFRHKLGITVAGHKVTLRANAEFVVAEIPADIDVELVSINRRDKLFQLKETSLRVPDFPELKVFSRSSSEDIKEFLGLPSLRQALGKLRLKQAESLHIYRNGPVLYSQPESSEEILQAVEAVCDLVEKLPPLDDTAELNTLPREFKKLFPLMRTWAISDDELKSEILERKSRKELAEFVAAVEPYFPAINEYLDSFGDRAHSEAAVALGRLAECAADAKIILGENQEN